MDNRFIWSDFGDKAIRCEVDEFILIIDDITDSQIDPRYHARTFMAWGDEPYIHRDFPIGEGYDLEDAIAWAEDVVPAGIEQ